MLELLIFALLTFLILEKRDGTTDLEREPDCIDLFLFILEVDGARREIYTFKQDIEEILKQEKIILQNEDYFVEKISEDVYYIKVILSHRKEWQTGKVTPFNREIRGEYIEGSPFLTQRFRGKRIKLLPFSS